MGEYRQSFKDLGYGFPADLIAPWCEVDLKTARHWKAGTTEPGSSASKLVALNVKAQVRPASWEVHQARNVWTSQRQPIAGAGRNICGLCQKISRCCEYILGAICVIIVHSRYDTLEKIA